MINKVMVYSSTRDLQDLVKKTILRRTGELKATRYFLNLDLPKIKPIQLEDIS